MKPTLIKADNFGGGNLAVNLSSVNIVCGRNAAGKTRVLNALRMGLLGYVPGVSKTNPEQMRFASGDSMTVQVFFSDGRFNLVNLSRKGGKVSRTESRHVAVSEMLLDMSAFYGLTEQQRMRHVCGVAMRDDDWNDRAVARAVANIGVAARPEIALVATNAIRAQWDAEILARPKWLANGASFPEWVAAQVDAWKEKIKGYKQQQPALAAKVAVLRESSAITARDFSAQIAQVEKELNQAGERHAKLRCGLEAWEALENYRKVAAGNAKRLVVLKEKNLNMTRRQPVKPEGGIALRDIAKGETIKVKQNRDGSIESDAIDFGALSKYLCAQAEIEAVRAEIKALEGIKQPKSDLEEVTKKQVEEAREALQKVSDDLVGLRQAQRDYDLVQAAQKSLDAAEAELLLLQANREAAEKLLAVLEAEQERLMDAVFNRLLLTVNAFTEGFMPTVWYRNGEIGYWTKGNPVTHRLNPTEANKPEGWVTHQTFSGMERAVAYAGLGVALAAQSPCKAVMADEVMVDEVNKPKLVERYVELAQKGVIDCALLVEAMDGFRAAKPAWMPKALAKKVNVIKV